MATNLTEPPVVANVTIDGSPRQTTSAKAGDGQECPSYGRGERYTLRARKTAALFLLNLQQLVNLIHRDRLHLAIGPADVEQVDRLLGTQAERDRQFG